MKLIIKCTEVSEKDRIGNEYEAMDCSFIGNNHTINENYEIINIVQTNNILPTK